MNKISELFDDLLVLIGYYRLRGKIRKFTDRISEAWLFYKRGYSGAQWYSYDSMNIVTAVQCLRHLRFKSNVKPYPCSFNSREDWEVILDKIIFAFEELLADYCDLDWAIEICGKERFAHIGLYSFQSTFLDKPETLTIHKDYVLRHCLTSGRKYYTNNDRYAIQTRQDYDKMVEGLNLYVKYYGNLWD